MRNRYLLLTNQITVFVTTMICFSFLVSKDTTKLGLMLQAINLQVYMRFLQVYMRILRVYMRNRYLLLTNQITVFVTTMI